jgi:3-methyladenine DNA glycosylase AlkD
MLSKLQHVLRRQANPDRAKILQRFFKTGKGEYGAGDRFYGIPVPEQRKIAKQFRDLPLGDIETLLHRPFHEARLIALLLLVQRFRHSDAATQKKIYHRYLANTTFINSWDLVDLSAADIVGASLVNRDKSPLTRLARSKSLWERRIAMLATYHFIKQGNSDEALRIAKLLLGDHHDLIHKAVGWMLREVGGRCSLKAEEDFLEQYAAQMPRTMLRYAIEKFSPRKRKHYLTLQSSP